MKKMAGVLVIMGAMVSGCMNITASTQREDASVSALREVSDCVPIIFGLAYGTATVETALAQKAQLIENYNAPWQPIAKVRRVQLHDYQFLLFGARCVEVVGE